VEDIVHELPLDASPSDHSAVRADCGPAFSVGGAALPLDILPFRLDDVV
jgi:hypothetical protein